MHAVRRAAMTLLAAFATVVPARAAITTQAQPIVDRWITASGGPAALAADTALHVKGRQVAGGVRGTFEWWSWGPGRFVRIERVGTLALRMGFDGVSGWRTDLTSKKVAPLEGKDLEAMRADAWFFSEQWARPGQGGGSVRAGATAYSSEHALVSLDVTPPVGPERRLWFDSGTGLLVRETRHRDRYAWDVRVSDWKSLAGRKRALTEVEGDSVFFAAGYERRNVDSVRVETPRDTAVFSPPVSRAPVAWLKARGQVKLPFRYRRGHVWVRASVNGAPPADFILDTGCTMTAIDREQARGAGLQLEGQLAASGVGGVDTGGWAHVRSLRLLGPDGAGVEVRDLKVGVLELNDALETFEWDDAPGLVGYDVLSRFVVDLDFDHQAVTLSDPATFTYSGHGQPVPFTLWACIPTVEVVLNGSCRGRFMVDVGNATPMAVHSDQVDACRLFGHASKEVQTWVGGIGGFFPETVCRLDSMAVGPFRWREPVAGLTLHHIGAAGSKDLQGNIGTSVLERFRCTFDYARSTLWLEPGARYAEREPFSRSGLYVVRHSGQVVVAAVVKHSPAADAGLKVRDVIKAVEGRPIDRWTPEALEALLDRGPAGQVVRVTIERELVDRQVEMTLADVL